METGPAAPAGTAAGTGPHNPAAALAGRSPLDADSPPAAALAARGSPLRLTLL